jgi:hypothetical protein
MAHDHNDNGHKENKPVAFITPLICGLVAVFIILAFTSLGNPCPHKEECCTGKECSKECMEKCEKGDHKECNEGMEDHHATEAKHEEHAAESTAAETPALADSTAKEEPVKEEAHH